MQEGEIGPAVTNGDIWIMHSLEGNLNLTRISYTTKYVSCLFSFPTLRPAFLDPLSLKDKLEKACTVLVTDK